MIFMDSIARHWDPVETPQGSRVCSRYINKVCRTYGKVVDKNIYIFGDFLDFFRIDIAGVPYLK